VRSDLGDKKGAIEDFNQAIRIAPSFAQAYFTRGMARFISDDAQGAIKDFNKAVELYDNQGNQAEKNDVLSILRKIQN
jgi:tetratricopeptide (TPR) repeat protein